jgi:lysophospholipase L1-like esterase
MARAKYRSYVAIGDSLSEGLGDFTFNEKREHNGWTDRLAALLSTEAAEAGIAGADFHYANLALRGSKMRTIMGAQLEAALRLQPDLVTVMAGSNDFSTRDLAALERIFRDGLQLLLAAGSDVVVANTIRPAHLKFFRKVLPRAYRMSQMIDRVAASLGIPVIDVHGIEDFTDLVYWAEDMVHFSGHGHIRVANEAAATLGLTHRIPEAARHEMTAPSRNLLATLRWYKEYVLPFIERRLRGTSSGDGLTSKHLQLVPFANLEFDVVRVPATRDAYATAA